MSDIFGLNKVAGDKGFRSPDGDAAFTFGTSQVSLIQQWNVQYQQNVQPIFECGSSKVYFSSKHSNGTLSIGRIVAENPTDLIRGIGTVCNPKPGQLTAAEGCQGTSHVSLRFTKMVATSVGFSGQAQQAYVSEDVQCMFAGLSA